MADEKQFDTASSSSSDPKHGAVTLQQDSHFHPTTLADVAPVERSSNPFMRIYSKPVVQVALVGMVCFLTSGMYNSITGIGGGGQVNADTSNKSAVALNSTFSVVSFFAGTWPTSCGLCRITGGGATDADEDKCGLDDDDEGLKADGADGECEAVETSSAVGRGASWSRGRLGMA